MPDRENISKVSSSIILKEKRKEKKMQTDKNVLRRKEGVGSERVRFVPLEQQETRLPSLSPSLCRR